MLRGWRLQGCRAGAATGAAGWCNRCPNSTCTGVQVIRACLYCSWCWWCSCRWQRCRHWCCRGGGKTLCGTGHCLSCPAAHRSIGSQHRIVLKACSQSCIIRYWTVGDNCSGTCTSSDALRCTPAQPAPVKPGWMCHAAKRKSALTQQGSSCCAQCLHEGEVQLSLRCTSAGNHTAKHC